MLEFLKQIIIAEWTALPADEAGNAGQMTEERLKQLVGRAPGDRLAASGIEVMLTSPAVDAVLPFLCSPPQRFPRSVVRHSHEYENAAASIAGGKAYLCRLLIERAEAVWGSDGPALRSLLDKLERGAKENAAESSRLWRSGGV